MIGSALILGDKCQLVRLLVHGDGESLDCCLETIMSGVPLVVMAGTGGAADLLVKTLRNQRGGKSKSEPTDTEYV